MDTTPSGFVVFQVELFEHPTSLPVANDEFLKDNRLHDRNINFPFPEPLGTLNRLLISGIGYDRCPTIGGTGKEGANFDIEASSFEDLDYRHNERSQIYCW